MRPGRAFFAFGLPGSGCSGLYYVVRNAFTWLIFGTGAVALGIAIGLVWMRPTTPPSAAPATAAHPTPRAADPPAGAAKGALPSLEDRRPRP